MCFGDLNERKVRSALAAAQAAGVADSDLLMARALIADLEDKAEQARQAEERKREALVRLERAVAERAPTTLRIEIDHARGLGLDVAAAEAVLAAAQEEAARQRAAEEARRAALAELYAAEQARDLVRIDAALAGAAAADVPADETRSAAALAEELRAHFARVEQARESLGAALAGEDLGALRAAVHAARDLGLDTADAEERLRAAAERREKAAAALLAASTIADLQAAIAEAQSAKVGASGASQIRKVRFVL